MAAAVDVQVAVVADAAAVAVVVIAWVPAVECIFVVPLVVVVGAVDDSSATAGHGNPAVVAAVVGCATGRFASVVEEGSSEVAMGEVVVEVVGGSMTVMAVEAVEVVGSCCWEEAAGVAGSLAGRVLTWWTFLARLVNVMVVA